MKINKKKLAFLKGKKIYLRQFLKTDISEKYLEWINSFKNNFFLETGRIPVSYQDLQNYFKENTKSKKSILFAICDYKDKHIGNCSISQIDWFNRKCSYGRLIGEKNSIKGAGTESLELMQKFAFLDLNLNSMWTAVCEKNIASIKSNIKAGMIKTGYMKEAFYKSGKFYNVTILSITKREYLKKIRK